MSVLLGEDQFQPAAKTKRIQFSVEYDSALPKMFIGSRSTLHRVVLNLVSNAIKFIDEGCVTLSVSLASLTGDQASVAIQVKDTGMHISKGKQSEIFQKLTRLTSAHAGK